MKEHSGKKEMKRDYLYYWPKSKFLPRDAEIVGSDHIYNSAQT